MESRLRSLVYVLTSLTALGLAVGAHAQRVVGGVRLYGHEWIVDGVDYVKLAVAERGVHRVTYDDLRSAGWTDIAGAELKLEQYGVEVALYVPEAGAWEPGDYAEFVVDDEARAAYEAELFADGDGGNLNPDYGMITDTIAMALSRQAGTHLRYTETAGAVTGSVDASTGAFASVGPTTAPTILHKQRFDQYGQQYSSYRRGEGWGRALSANQDIAFETPQLRDDRPARVELRLIVPFHRSSDFDGDRRRVGFKANGLDVGSDTVRKNDILLRTFIVPTSALAPDSQVVNVAGLSGDFRDWYGIGLARLRYAAGLAVDDTQVSRTPFPEDLARGRHTWTALDPGVEHVVFDPVARRVQRLPRAATATSALPGLTDGTELYVASARTVHRPTVGEFVTGTVTEATDADYLIVTTHAFDGWDVNAQDYADMRRSDEFGGHVVRVVYVEDLMDQFAYGQIRDPRAIRNAIQYYVAEGQLKYVLLLGKGREVDAVRLPEQLQAPNNASNYIPTYGVPGADNLIAADAQTGQLTVAIGRMAIETEADIVTIMGKVRDTERARQLPQTIAHHEWQKEIVHLSGGSDPQQQSELRGRLARMQRVAEASERAMAFEVFGKNSSEPVSEATRIEIYDAINDGTALVTFFGHAAASTFDFNIDNPEFYDNAGRYPALLGLGCNAGNMHLPGKSIGERFLIYEDKAFSGFGASIGLGYTGDLERFGTQLYSLLGTEARDQSFAECLRRTLNSALLAGGSTMQQLGEQFSFQGDPAMMLYNDPGPDYIVDERTVSVEVDEDGALRYGVTVANVGLRGTDSVLVRVFRRSPARSRTLVDSFRLAAFGNRRAVERQVEGWADEGAGLNALSFELSTPLADEEPAPGAIANNRSAEVEFLVGLTGLQIAWPLPDAYLEKDSVRFAAYSSGIFAPGKRVTWQLAADPTFDNVIDSASAEVRGAFFWRSDYEFAPGQTYYVRAKGPAGARSDSRITAFTVAPNGSFPEGAFYGRLQTPEQIRGGSSGEGVRIEDDGSWTFEGFAFYIGMRNLEYDPANQPFYSYNLGQSAEGFRPWLSVSEGVGIGITRGRSGGLVRNTGGLYGSIPSSRELAFAFPTETEEQRANIVTFLDEVVEDYAFVFFMSIFDRASAYDFDAWNRDARPIGAYLASQGAQQAEEWTSSTESRPYLLVYKKAEGLLDEALGATRSDVITTTTYIEVDSDRGLYRSGPFGGREDYRAVDYALEDGPIDSLSVRLLRLNLAGDSLAVLDSSDLRAGSFDVTAVELAPEERFGLRIYQRDTVEYTAKALASLTLEYVPLPDLALTNLPDQNVPADSLDLGQAIETHVRVVNLSPTPAEDAIVAIAQTDNVDGLVYGDTIATLPGWGTWDHTADLPLREESGAATVRYEVTAGSHERETFNNVVDQSAFVRRDGIAPGLVVRINGERPSPGVMLVSEPVFQIEALDDNVYRALSEDNLVIELTDPDQRVTSRRAGDLPGRLELVNQETTDGDRPAQRVEFEFEPGDIMAGVYELRVGVADASDNQARTLQLVRFELDNRTAISNVLPYPNPGVDNVRFQYESTGAVPQQFQINIYTTSGRLVHSLTEAELGALKNGRNLTDGAWNGTDQFGQRLGRGVYLYRFETSDETGDLEQRETDMDDYIKSGFGKLVLLK